MIGDPELFAALEAAGDLSSLERFNPNLLQAILQRSAAAKAQVVAADEHEAGLRAILNYGHTLGHVVETLSGYGTWLHGEAVAIGMVAAGELSLAMGLWADEDQARQKRLIQAAGLPLRFPPLQREALVQCLQGDKKVKAGQIRFVLPSAIGAVAIHDDVTLESIFAITNTN